MERRHFCGMLDGLAFLPLNEVDNGMAHLRPLSPVGWEELTEYFDQTYVTGRANMQANGALHLAPPIFSPALWNVHQATLDGGARTNNVMEGWNNRFHNLVGFYHPPVGRLCTWLQKENAAVEAIVHQDDIGQRAPRCKKKTSEQLQARLRDLCDDYVSGRKQLDAFLRGIGHNIAIHRMTPQDDADQ